MIPIRHNPPGIPAAPIHPQEFWSSSVTKVALTALSAIGFVLSFVFKMPLLAIIPGAYLSYQAFQWLHCNSDSASRILGAAIEGLNRYNANHDQEVYVGLRGGSNQGERARVGEGHTRTPAGNSFPAGGSQMGGRAPVGHGHTRTPSGDTRRAYQGEEPDPRRRTPGPQQGPRAPVGHS